MKTYLTIFMALATMACSQKTTELVEDDCKPLPPYENYRTGFVFYRESGTHNKVFIMNNTSRYMTKEGAFTDLNDQAYMVDIADSCELKRIYWAHDNAIPYYFRSDPKFPVTFGYVDNMPSSPDTTKGHYIGRFDTTFRAGSFNINRMWVMDSCFSFTHVSVYAPRDYMPIRPDCKQDRWIDINTTYIVNDTTLRAGLQITENVLYVDKDGLHVRDSAQAIHALLFLIDQYQRR